MTQESKTPVGFIVGDSLGKLLKWLRIFGFSAILDRKYATGETNLDPKKYDIVYLTRTRPKQKIEWTNTLYISNDRVFEQLRAVVRACRISPKHLQLFSRCLHCNTVIKPIEKTHVKRRVPDFVWESHEKFSYCPTCNQIFWQGTHTVKVKEIIERVFETVSDDI